MVNPFPLVRDRGHGRALAHRNPMLPWRAERSGRYRPKVVQRVPRQIPDEKFGELFAALGSHRDRALVSLWVSSGVRASELLGVTCADADPGQQLITVIRKGSRVLQQLPASPDAFVWLRLYQAQTQGLVPARPDDPLWWTLRKPFRPLTYHAARAMFVRANGSLGANWSLHDLRHTAVYQFPRSADADHGCAVGSWPRASVHYPAVPEPTLGNCIRRARLRWSPGQRDPAIAACCV